jgi:acetylornithine deacetylase
MAVAENEVLEMVIQKIDELWEEEVAFLQTIGRYPNTIGNEGAVQNYIVNYFEQLGLETDKFVPDLKIISKIPGYSPGQTGSGGAMENNRTEDRKKFNFGRPYCVPSPHPIQSESM